MNTKKYLAALAIGAVLNSSCARKETYSELYNLRQTQESQDVTKYSSLDELLQKDEKARNYQQTAMEKVKLYAGELSKGADNTNPRTYSELESAIERWYSYTDQRIPKQKGEIADIINNDKTKRIAFYTVAIVDEVIDEKINKEWKKYETKRENKLKQIYHELVAKHPEKLRVNYGEFKDALTKSLDNAKPENLDETIYMEAQKYLPEYLWTQKWFEHHIMKPFAYDGAWSQDKNIRDNIQMPLHRSGLLNLKEKSLEEFAKSKNK